MMKYRRYDTCGVYADRILTIGDIVQIHLLSFVPVEGSEHQMRRLDLEC